MAATAVAVKTKTTIARPLSVLVPLIQADLERAESAGMEYYANAGDKLIEAKNSNQVRESGWSRWLSQNFSLSKWTARKYMRLATWAAQQPRERGALLWPKSMNEFVGDTARTRKRRKAESKYKTVLRELETDFYSQAEQARDDEVKLHRELALEVIDVGYKALATRLHPDRGGSKDAMSRLNRVRDVLKSVAKKKRFV